MRRNRSRRTTTRRRRRRRRREGGPKRPHPNGGPKFSERQFSSLVRGAEGAGRLPQRAVCVAACRCAAHGWACWPAMPPQQPYIRRGCCSCRLFAPPPPYFFLMTTTTAGALLKWLCSLCWCCVYLVACLLVRVSAFRAPAGLFVCVFNYFAV